MPWRSLLAVLLGGLVLPVAAVARTPGPVAPPSRAAAPLAKVVVATTARSAPGRGRVVQRLATRARWGHGPVVLLVLESATTDDGLVWLRVRLPVRPNDADGWIRADHVLLERTTWRLEIATSTRRARVLHRWRVVRSFGIVVGAPGTPTPAGLFAIAEKIRQADPRGFLGPWALHLTAHSRVLFDFGGGEGRIALHGRDGASLADPIGSAASHGCVRMDDRNVRYLARVLPTGAPVRIVRSFSPLAA